MLVKSSKDSTGHGYAECTPRPHTDSMRRAPHVVVRGIMHGMTLVNHELWDCILAMSSMRTGSGGSTPSKRHHVRSAHAG